MQLIEVKKLIYEYLSFHQNDKEPTKKTALKNIDLQIHEGDFVGIVGHNGSGKSTLAKQLASLLFPTSGSVFIEGMDTSEEKNHIPARQIAGMVFQNPDNQLIGNIVEEDIAFGPENLGLTVKEIWNRVSHALEVTGMSAYIRTSPHALSGGQKQKIAISGILAMEPKCIILDEPTAMLDPNGREEVMEALKELNKDKGITILLITHHMDEIEHADYLYVMEHGSIAMEGKPEEIWKNETKLTALGLELPFNEKISSLLKKNKMGNSCSEIEYGLEIIENELKRVPRKEVPQKEVPQKGVPQKEVSQKEVPQEVLQKEILKFDKIFYKYPQNMGQSKYALKDVSFSMKQGEFIALIGKSGSGKTTFAQHLNGLLKPEQGRYLFCGEDVYGKNYKMGTLRQKIGLCFQYPEYQLFEENILKDVAFGPKNLGYTKSEAEEKAREAMRLMDLGKEYERVSPFALSGGQKRRVAIAGILAMEPRVLVLDEPAAGMDLRGKEELFRILHYLNKEKKTSILLISHDMDDVAAHADRVIVMDEGCIKMDDTPRMIFSRRKKLKELGLQLPRSAEFFVQYRKYKENKLNEDEMVPLTIDELLDRLKTNE